MTQLPAAFTEKTRQLMGEERFERYLQSFEEEPPVSIRVNPKKVDDGRWEIAEGTPVPWCRNGYYLQKRPNFTMDPLLHAGCYYVQEAASMFLDEALRQHLTSAVRPLTSLDMCAAPGGKSTLLRSVLPEDCVLYSNEPIRNRANILLENVTKWGYDNHIVTNNYPKDYRASKLRFDVSPQSTPTISKRPGNLDCASFSFGIPLRHILHHVPQKSSTTYLPLRLERVKSLPAVSGRVKSGAYSGASS